MICVLQARHEGRIVAIEAGSLCDVACSPAETRFRVRTSASGCAPVALDVCARHVVLAAGAGNDELRRRFGLPAGRMQRRPLRMVALRGRLPEFSGHCVDGAATRVTITSQRRSDGTVVWQLGGQIAERGAGLARERPRGAGKDPRLRPKTF